MRVRAAVLLVVFGRIALAGADMSAAPADFTLSRGEQTFRAADARGRVVALHFLLATECPYCLKHTETYATRGDELAGVQHVFIKPDDEAALKAWESKLPESVRQRCALFGDAGGELAKRYGLPADYAFHGTTMNYPALILLGPDGREAFRFVGKNNADRLPFERLADEIEKLTRNPEVGQFNLGGDRVALKGYDATAYLDEGRAQKGDAKFASRYRGVVYQFASAANRAKFAANPEKYVPAYGGWCATAMAEGGRKVDIDPANFKVTGGRLFVFYKGWLGDALKEWNKDEAGQTVKADGEWRKLAPQDRPVETK